MSRSFVRTVVYSVIDKERDYQDKKWGGESNDEKNTLENWISFMKDHLLVAETADKLGEELLAREEVRKIVALGVACLEYTGIPER